MKTSIIVPCAAEHFHLLDRMIHSYCQGTAMPDNMIISVSNAQNINRTMQSELLHNYTRFPIEFIEFKRNVGSGENRQKASMVSNNDILIYQDADDLTHPQRVEALRYAYENSDAWHISHFWIPSYYPFDEYEIDKIKLEKVESSDPEIHGKPYGSKFGKVTAGATSVRREMINHVSWGNSTREWGEDWHFNMNCLNAINQSYILHAEIYVYTKFQHIVEPEIQSGI